MTKNEVLTLQRDTAAVKVPSGRTAGPTAIAVEVHRPGAYLGFLEWVAWSVMERRQVLMLFGSEEWDLMHLFATDHPPRGLRRCLSCLRCDLRDG